MRDFKKLTEGLRYCDDHYEPTDCKQCPIHKECNKHDAYTRSLAADAIEELLALCNQLRPKTGKWIPDDEDDPRLVVPIRCSVCHSLAHFEDWNRRFVLSEYCPHCGAKMEVNDDA